MNTSESQKITEMLKTAAASNSVINITIKPNTVKENLAPVNTKKGRSLSDDEDNNGYNSGEEEDEEGEERGYIPSNKRRQKTFLSTLGEKPFQSMHSAIQEFTNSFFRRLAKPPYEDEFQSILKYGADILDTHYTDIVSSSFTEEMPSRRLVFYVDDIFKIGSTFLSNITALPNLIDWSIKEDDKNENKLILEVKLCGCSETIKAHINGTIEKQEFLKKIPGLDIKNMNNASKIIHGKVASLFAFNHKVPWTSEVNPSTNTYAITIPVYLPIFQFQLKQLFIDPVVSSFNIHKQQGGKLVYIEIITPDIKEFKDGFVF